MTELLTAAQMRAIEQAAIEAGEVTGLELMERAGRGVVEAILEWRPELAKTAHRAVVLCGPGNNGGDGFVVARLLKERGWEVEVFFYGDEKRLPPDAAKNAQRWHEIGDLSPLVAGALETAVHRSLESRHEKLVTDEMGICRSVDLETSQRTIFIDALFGIGLNRPLAPDLAEIIRREWTDTCWEDGVAIDIPSGICADSGEYIGKVGTYAAMTVTFQQEKRGHRLGAWNEDCRSLRTVNLGIDGIYEGQCVLNDCTNACSEVLGDWWHKKLSTRNKYHFGHALIMAGGSGKGGAARLAARAALRTGAGLVSVSSPQAAMTENAARLDAIMLRPIDNPETLVRTLKDQRINALCIGPGFGIGRHCRDMVTTALAHRENVVLDADALTSFKEDPSKLFGHLRKGCILTPHQGEFGRLFPDLLAKLTEPATKGPAYSKVDATREAAARAGCVVLFKGADTVIAAPDGRCSINSAHYERAAPWLATAGSGDVLAGFITGLLARGLNPMSAAETAAWLHVECARKFGPGLIAEDLPEQLPAVFRDLGL